MENNIHSNDLINLDINNFESFLIKSGYLNPKIWTKKNSDFFDPNKYNEILVSFEFNEKISPTEASVKYGDKIQWINKIFKTDITFEELLSQYVHYTSTNISFVKLLNNFIMMEIVLKQFYNVINKDNEEDINKIFSKEIIMNDIDINSSLHDKNILGLKQKLELIYTKFNQSSSYNGKEVNSKLIAIIFLLSFGSSFSIDKNIPQITNLMNVFSLYNKIYVSDINVCLILYFSIIIYINICIYANKKKSHFKYLTYDNNNYNTFYYQELKKKSPDNANPQNEDKTNYISMIIFDNNIITYSGNYFIELLIFQDYLKIFSIYHLSKNQIKATINLTIDTMVETIKTFNNNIIINTDLQKNNTIINNMIENPDNLNIYPIKLNNLILLTKNNLSKCFFSFNFNEIVLKVTNFQTENQIKEINLRYLELIQKARKLYFQNSITTLNQTNNNNAINNDINKVIDNVSNNFDSIDYLKIEFTALIHLLTYYNKNKEAKKFLQFYCFKFRFFKCSIFRENKKEIQLYFDYSSIKEKILLKYLREISNILNLIKNYEEVINAINEFKLYNITFRVCQSNFRSRHINFFFSIIIKRLVLFIEENRYNRITIYDSKLKTYEENMLVYIKDNSIKVKSRINTLKEMFNNSIFKNKLKVFNGYVKDLVDDWDIIIIGENIKYHNLIYSNNTNILFLNIVEEKDDNSVQKFMAGSSINPLKYSVMNIGMSDPEGDNKAQNNVVNNEYLNILMYIISDENFADKTLKFCEDLKGNNNCVLINKITFICERYFFEDKIIMSSRIKGGSKVIYNYVDNYFLVCDKIKDKEVYKYDLFITKNYVSLSNNIIQEVTKDFSQIIYSFISVLSSCVELIIYIYKNKETEPNKFYYLQKISKDYYLFEYKMANIFIKKLKSFDSLLLLNPKKSIPLFCLLAKKQNTDYITTNDSFLDLFLRLFLNLNKVVDKNKLNENFFEKIHKNLFYQNYDIFQLMTYSYEAFCTFNDIFINNNYLQISKDDKFEICYIIPYEFESEQKRVNYKKILENKKDDKLMVKNIKIFDYNLTNAFIFKMANELKMNYRKAEFFIEYFNNSINNDNSIGDKMKIIFKKLKDKKIEKEKLKKILLNIKNLYYEKDNIIYYGYNITKFEKALIEFNTEKVKIKAVKLDFGSIRI